MITELHTLINAEIAFLRLIIIFKESETFSMFTSSYVNTSASLVEREMCGNTSPKGECRK
jgi:hypothetical protein